MPKNIIEMINALNNEHKYAIADAVHNFEDSGSNYPKAMTSTEFKDYLISKGWTWGGSIQYSAGGKTETLTSTSGFILPLFPEENFPEDEYFIVIPDETSIPFRSPEMNSRGTLRLTSPIAIANSDPTKMYFVYISKTSIGTFKINELSSDGMKSFVANKTNTIGKRDYFTLAKISGGRIEISKGYNATFASEDTICLRLGNTVLNENKLQALLALVNQ